MSYERRSHLAYLNICNINHIGLFCNYLIIKVYLLSLIFLQIQTLISLMSKMKTFGSALRQSFIIGK